MAFVWSSGQQLLKQHIVNVTIEIIVNASCHMFVRRTGGVLCSVGVAMIHCLLTCPVCHPSCHGALIQ